MKRTLYKAILKSRNTTIITLSLSMIGIYVGYLIWYVLGHYLPGSISGYRVFVSILAIWISAFIGIYKIPDQLFTNRRIKDVLCFPLSSSRLVLLVIGRLACLQLGVTIFAFWACFLYDTSDWLSTVTIMLLCWIGSCLIDLLVFYPDKWLLMAILAAALSTLCAYFFVKSGYVRGYLNTQNFQYQKANKTTAPTKIKNPYFLLEWKRVSRNKELIFFSNIKNILTVIVLCGLLVQNFDWIGVSEQYTMELFLLVSCCAVNTISSTVYSSDPNKAYLSFLPVSTHRLFFWKTLQGFFWGEITVLLFWAGATFFHGISARDAFLLLIYGTVMNYGCVWLGVFLDYKMPRSPNSTNELLHGNISKVIVLFASITLTVGEIYFTTQINDFISLLTFSVCVSSCVVAIECLYWLFCRRSFRD